MLGSASHNLNCRIVASLLVAFVFVGCGQQTEGGLLQSSASINGMFLVSEIEPNTALPGTTIVIKGVGFSSDLKVSIDGTEIPVLSRTGDKSMSVNIPEGKPGMTKLSVYNTKDQTSIKFVRLSADGFPVVASDSAKNFCKGSNFYSMEGTLLEGERTCETPLPFCSSEGQNNCITSENFLAVDKTKLRAENFKAGFSIAGIEGTLEGAPSPCTSDGEVGCITSDQVKAAKLSNFSATDIIQGVSVAGVTGTRTDTLPPECSTNGGDNCIVKAPFKALNPAIVDASKMLSSLTVLGVTGTIVERTTWNMTTAFPGAGYYPGVSNPPLAALRSSATINGVAGAITDCGADGSDCFLPAYALSTQPRKAINFDTIDPGKMLTSQTVAGKTGTIPVIGTWDVTATFPGSGYYTAVSNPPLSSLKTTATINGSSGTLATCGANGSNCFLPAYALTTQPKKAIDYDAIDIDKMLSTQTIDGKTGTIVSHGTLDLTLSFPGPGVYTGVSNAPLSSLLSTATINGVAGTVSTCGIDGSACYLPAYVLTTQPKKAINYDTIDTGKMLSTLTVAGKSGVIATRGTWDLTTTFPGSGFYTAVSNAPTAALRSTTSINGINGSLTDCATNGTNCFLPPYSGTQPKKALDYDAIDVTKMLTTMTIDDKTGTIETKGTLDLSAAFPGVGLYTGVTNAPTASLLSSASINGVAGSVTDCGTDGSACYLPAYVSSVQPKKAIDYDGIDPAKMLTTQIVSGKVGTIAVQGSWDLATTFPGQGFYTGVTNNPSASLRASASINGINGAIADCNANGSNCFLPSYAAGTQPKKAIDYDSIDTAKMLTTQTIDGKTGTILTRGSWDLTSSFPGSGYFTGVSNAPTASLRSNATINGVSGAISDCATNDSNCFLPNYTAFTQPKKAIDYDAIDASKMLSTQTIDGKTGSITSRGSWDIRTTFPGAGYYSGVTDAPSAALRNSTTINGVTGAIAPCTNDSSDCYIEPYAAGSNPLKALDYDAVDTGKMLSTQTIGGKTGSIASQGTWDMTTSFPGAGYFVNVANAPLSDLRSSATLNGSAGSITLCTSDGSGCYLPPYVGGIQPLKAIDYSQIDASKMLTTMTLSGVSGSITARGSWNLTSSFPGAGYYSGVTNTPSTSDIKDSVSIVGITGNVVPTPATCANDAEIGCVTNASFKAAKMANVLQGNIKATVQIAGVTGNYGGGASEACTYDGDVGCLVNGTTFVAADVQAATAGNIRKDVQIAGTTGSYTGGASVSIVEPTGNNDFVTPGSNFNITYHSTRPGSDPSGTINLYYRADGLKTGCTGDPVTNGWTLLASSLDENSTSWNWTSIPRGTYNICALFDNGVNQAYEVSSGKLNAKDSTIFISAASYRGGDIGSIANGDTICQSLATAGSLPFASSYRALLSNNFIHARDRLDLGANIYNTRNEIVSTVTNFWSGTHSVAIYRIDTTAQSTNAWTGTTGFGHSTGDGCINWSSNSSGAYGTTGNSGDTSYFWTMHVYDTCNNVRALYCIGDR